MPLVERHIRIAAPTDRVWEVLVVAAVLRADLRRLKRLVETGAV